MFNAVVLPAPEAPKMTVNSPCSMAKLASLSAFMETPSVLYSFTILLNSM